MIRFETEQVIERPVGHVPRPAGHVRRPVGHNLGPDFRHL